MAPEQEMPNKSVDMNDLELESMESQSVKEV
jgi:hypothetical protein